MKPLSRFARSSLAMIFLRRLKDKNHLPLTSAYRESGVDSGLHTLRLKSRIVEYSSSLVHEDDYGDC